VKLEVSRRRLLAGGIGAVFLIGIAIAAWQSKSVDIPLVSEGHSVARAQAQHGGDDRPVASTDLENCIAVWNSYENSYPRQSLTNLGEGLYVSVTTSKLYSRKCLITAANPELNLAAQFFEGGSGTNASGSPFSPSATGSADSLPSSVTNWNASADGKGYLALKP
jgi:hypothetical protein